MEQTKREIKFYLNSEETPVEKKKKESWWETLLIRSGIEQNYPFLTSVLIGLSAACYFIGYSITGNPRLSVIFVFLGPFLMWQYFTYCIEKNDTTMYKQVGELAKLMSNAIRSNLTLEAALPQVAEKLENPIRQYIAEAARRCALGEPVLDALHEAKKYIRTEPFNLFIRASAIAKRKGGDLAESYNDIFKTVNKSLNAREKVRVVNKSAIRRGLFVTAVPVVMIVIMRSIAPEYMAPLFNTFGGYVVLLIVVVLIVSAWAIIRKLCRVELI